MKELVSGLFTIAPARYSTWRNVPELDAFCGCCRLLTKPSIQLKEVIEAHHELMEFCRGCEQLYGPEFITPNMHMHEHLGDTILDFEPIYAFWLFTFERYNGLLGNIDSNKKASFEITFLKGFYRMPMLQTSFETRQSNSTTLPKPSSSGALLKTLRHPPR